MIGKCFIEASEISNVTEEEKNICFTYKSYSFFSSISAITIYCWDLSSFTLSSVAFSAFPYLLINWKIIVISNINCHQSSFTYGKGKEKVN